MDQNQFGRIADAICRDDRTSPDFRVYCQLKALVDADRARVYFSLAHVVEALRFGNVRSPIAVSYCKVVDALTCGHCIRFVLHLWQAELELALAEAFGFPTQYSRETYPYGKYADAVTTDGLHLNYESIGLSADSALREIDKLHERLRPELPNRRAVRSFLSTLSPAAEREANALLPRGMTAKEFMRIVVTGSESDRRALAVSVFTNEDFVRRMMQSMPEETFAELTKQFPATDFHWTREAAIIALTGSAEERDRVWKSFFDGVITFSQLVTNYSLTASELAGVGRMFDTDGSNLVNHVRAMQRLEPLRAAILGTPATWDRDIAKDFGARFIASNADEIRSYATKHGFSPEVAMRRLSADGFKKLPYVRARTAWIQSYLARHKGTKFARTPEVNDVRDFLHCANTPYVDILVTERFAGEVTRRVGEQFGTRVVTSLEELLREMPTAS